MAKILICSNFSGRYNKKYIGHEFINLFPSDAGCWNFYVPSYGCVKKDYGKGNEPDYLIMVEPINGIYRLLGIASGLEYASDCYSSTDKEEVLKENSAHGSICYFSKPLNWWFGSQPNTLFVSYKLKNQGNIFMPNANIDLFVSLAKGKINNNSCTDDEIFIYDSWACYGKDRKKLIGQSQRSFYDDKNCQKSISNQINDLLNRGLLYDASKAKPLSGPAIKAMYPRYFIEMIGQQNNENAFSDSLAEYLSNVEFYNHFAKKLGLQPVYKILNITREKDVGDQKRIDIYIETDKEIVLIENKIHSSIHTSKINGAIISQLDVYINNVKKEIGNSKTIRSFLLCPDYYDKYGYAGSSSLWNKSVWSPLFYSKLKDIVDTFMTLPGYLNNRLTKFIYMDEFSRALDTHSKTKPESIRDVILREIAKRL